MPKKVQGPLGTSPPWQRLKLSASILQDLKSQWSILHLLHHRSQNQHRRSAWYRHFNVFRKQLRLVIDELDPDVSADALPSRKFKVYKEAMRKVELRLQWWADVVVEKWYCAFVGLIGDKQFAVLGLTLLAALGRAVQVLNVQEKMEDRGDGGGMKQDLTDAARRQGKEYDVERDAVVVDHDLGVPVERTDDASGEGDDIGVAVSRDMVESQNGEKEIPSRREDEDEVDEASSKSTPAKTRSSKKKRKRGDEIDDLF